MDSSQYEISGNKSKFILYALVFYFLVAINPVNAKEKFEVIDVQITSSSSNQMTQNQLDNKQKLVELLRSKGLENFSIVLKLQPMARARYSIDNNPWCLSFIPPIDKSDIIISAIDNQVKTVNLIRLKQKGSFEWYDLRELKGLKVATARDNDNSELSMLLSQSGLDIFYVSTYEQALHLVLKGRVQYAIGNSDLLHDLDNTELLMKSLQLSGTTLMEYNTYVFINKQCEIARYFEQ